MSTSTIQIETRISALMGTMNALMFEAADLYKLYWSEVSTDATFTALGSGAAATYTTKLTKQEVINALTLSEQMDRFFTNQSLTQADYRTNMNGIRYGNDQYAMAGGISVAIETFGERAVTFINQLFQLFDEAKCILDLYFDTEISGAVGAVTGASLPWTTIEKSDFTGSITLIENYKKLINNEVATAGDYGATVAKWVKIVS